MLARNGLANVRAKGTDLVAVKGNIVDAAFAELMKGQELKRPRPLKPPKSAYAYAAGAEAGERVRLGTDKEVTDGARASKTTPAQGRDDSAAPHRPKIALPAWSSELGRLLRSGIIRLGR
jgi:hypothetical protein